MSQGLAAKTQRRKAKLAQISIMVPLRVENFDPVVYRSDSRDGW